MDCAEEQAAIILLRMKSDSLKRSHPVRVTANTYRVSVDGTERRVWSIRQPPARVDKIYTCVCGFSFWDGHEFSAHCHFCRWRTCALCRERPARNAVLVHKECMCVACRDCYETVVSGNSCPNCGAVLS